MNESETERRMREWQERDRYLAGLKERQAKGFPDVDLTKSPPGPPNPPEPLEGRQWG